MALNVRARIVDFSAVLVKVDPKERQVGFIAVAFHVDGDVAQSEQFLQFVVLVFSSFARRNNVGTVGQLLQRRAKRRVHHRWQGSSRLGGSGRSGRRNVPFGAGTYQLVVPRRKSWRCAVIEMLPIRAQGGSVSSSRRRRDGDADEIEEWTQPALERSRDCLLDVMNQTQYPFWGFGLHEEQPKFGMDDQSAASDNLEIAGSIVAAVVVGVALSSKRIHQIKVGVALECSQSVCNRGGASSDLTEMGSLVGHVACQSEQIGGPFNASNKEAFAA